MKCISTTLMIAASAALTPAAARASADDAAAPEQAFTVPVEVVTAASASAAEAASYSLDEPDTVDQDEGLNISFTPYLWMPAINGDVGIPRNDDEVDVDRSFSDIWGDLKFAFMGTVDGEYNRFVAHVDTIYLNLGADVERVDSLVFNEGEFDAKLLIMTGAIGYRVVDRGPMYVDLYAGARLVSLDIDLALEGPLQTREASASPSNVSPLIGGKARLPLSERWALALQGDIGFDSDVKWELAGTVQYQLGKHWLAGVGYRHLALHHDKEDAEFDIAFSGPLIAFTYMF